MHWFDQALSELSGFVCFFTFKILSLHDFSDLYQLQNNVPSSSQP